MEAEPEKIRNSISVVFQDFAHYEDTLRNNITVSDPERTSSDEELNQLLKELHVDAVINQQQLGLDSKIGSFSENSNNLSGGPVSYTHLKISHSSRDGDTDPKVSGFL